MLALLWILASTISIDTLQRPELTTPEVIVSVVPSVFDSYQLLRRKTPETFTCSVSVLQAGTRFGYLQGELVLRPGESDKMTQNNGEYSLEFAVAMKKQRAETVVTVKRGEKLLTRQRSTMYLQTPEGIVPLR